MLLQGHNCFIEVIDGYTVIADWSQHTSPFTIQIAKAVLKHKDFYEVVVREVLTDSQKAGTNRKPKAWTSSRIQSRSTKIFQSVFAVLSPGTQYTADFIHGFDGLFCTLDFTTPKSGVPPVLCKNRMTFYSIKDTSTVVSWNNLASHDYESPGKSTANLKKKLKRALSSGKKNCRLIVMDATDPKLIEKQSHEIPAQTYSFTLTDLNPGKEYLVHLVLHDSKQLEGKFKTSGVIASGSKEDVMWDKFLQSHSLLGVKNVLSSIGVDCVEEFVLLSEEDLVNASLPRLKVKRILNVVELVKWEKNTSKDSVIDQLLLMPSQG
jgi:hypothetical protein